MAVLNNFDHIKMVCILQAHKLDGGKGPSMRARCYQLASNQHKFYRKPLLSIKIDYYFYYLFTFYEVKVYP